MPPDNTPRHNSAGYCESCGNSPVEVVSIARGYDVYFCADCFQNGLNHFKYQKKAEPVFTSVSVIHEVTMEGTTESLYATTSKGQIVRVVIEGNKGNFWPMELTEREAP